MTLTAGAHLGPYEIVASLGAGGMGEVYRAKDTRLDRLVAIRVLRSFIPPSCEADRPDHGPEKANAFRKFGDVGMKGLSRLEST